MTAPAPSRPDLAPGFPDLVRTFARIGCLSFGGPAAQIALMQRELVDERGWLTQSRFLRALNFCMLLPGPEAMQLATYSGWLLHGARGGLAAGLLFVLPGAAVMLVLSSVYALYGQTPLVAALFIGIKAAVLAVVLQALVKVAGRALKGPAAWGLAGAAFLALTLGVPFPIVVLAALAFGAAVMTGEAEGDETPLPAGRPVRTALIWLAVWIAPLLALGAFVGPDHVLARVALVFSVLAAVSFGGAYAALAWLAQTAVEDEAWLTAPQMLDGLGLAETTPGPLVLVMQHVGFLAGFGAGGLTLGVVAALVTLWAVFAPCFLFVFTGAPLMERLARAPRVAGALSGVTAAVVGVILYLALWFGLQVLFGELAPVDLGIATLDRPVWGSLRPLELAIAIGAGLALLRFQVGLAKVLALAAIAGLATLI